MKLSHFTEKPFTFNPKQKYVNELFWIKPSGLWLSDESEYGWKQWCTNEQWGLDGLKHETKFQSDTKNWLILDTNEKLIEFTKQYSTKILPIITIEWDKVTKEYGGIIITPYQRSLRLRSEVSSWYYGWDCASACVWDLSSLKVIK